MLSLAAISCSVQGVWIILQFEVFVPGENAFSKWSESETPAYVDHVNIVCHSVTITLFCVSKVTIHQS